MDTALTPVDGTYPSSDGKPMAETWLHVRAIMWLHQALEDFFGGRPDVFIASDMFWYWQKGNPRSCVAPDVMVVTGLAPRDPWTRRSYFSWEEGGAVPAAVFEFASQNTWREDVEEKYQQYESLGVREYFLFDPEALYLTPPLQGYRLEDGIYRELPSDGMESLLGFGLRAEGMMIRLMDLRSGQPIPTRAEAVEAAKRRVEAEQQRADEEQRLREAEQKRADEEQRLREAEQKRAEAERQRIKNMESEIERLKSLLQKFGHTNGNGPGST
jgi:Uma2 family endonuclease